MLLGVPLCQNASDLNLHNFSLTTDTESQDYVRDRKHGYLNTTTEMEFCLAVTNEVKNLLFELFVLGQIYFEHSSNMLNLITILGGFLVEPKEFQCSKTFH